MIGPHPGHAAFVMITDTPSRVAGSGALSGKVGGQLCDTMLPCVSVISATLLEGTSNFEKSGQMLRSPAIDSVDNQLDVSLFGRRNGINEAWPFNLTLRFVLCDLSLCSCTLTSAVKLFEDVGNKIPYVIFLSSCDPSSSQYG